MTNAKLTSLRAQRLKRIAICMIDYTNQDRNIFTNLEKAEENIKICNDFIAFVCCFESKLAISQILKADCDDLPSFTLQISQHRDYASKIGKLLNDDRARVRKRMISTKKLLDATGFEEHRLFLDGSARLLKCWRLLRLRSDFLKIMRATPQELPED